MATPYLPSGFHSREEYLEAALRLLCQYEWLFNWPVTQILSCGMLDELPLEWWEPLQRLSLKNLNELPRGACHDRWPESLKRLVTACTALRLPVADLPLPIATHMEGRLRHALRKGMTPKKVHEVTHLAAVIHEQCAAANVKCIVDMGSGHGYLCEVLHHAYGYRVVGLESVADRVEESARRHEEICRAMGKPSGRVRYVECDVSADNPGPIAAALAQEADEEGRPLPFCLVGLHSCGDLTPSAVRLFQSLEQIKSMVLVACCYHRMSLAPTPAHCPPDALQPVSGRVGERQGKVERVLQWQVRRWSHEHRDNVHEDDEDHAEEIRLAVEWLGPRGPLLAARAPPAKEHFFNFPLSASLRHLTHCGRPQSWSAVCSTASSSASTTASSSSTVSSTASSSASTTASSSASTTASSSTSTSASSSASTTASSSTSTTASSSVSATASSSTSTTASLPSTASSMSACSFLRRPMLRLAAQETVERWEKMSVETHQRHSRHVMARAVFELYASANGIQLARRGSRCLRGAALSLDARAVLEEMVQRLVAGASAQELAQHKKAVCTLYAALEPLRPLVEALTALQSALQNVCEGLVLVDRLACLAAGTDQHAANAVTVRKVADQLLTPRCYALVATK